MASGSHHSSSHHSGSHHSSSHHSSHHSSSHRSGSYHSSHHYHSRAGYGAPMHVAGRYKTMGYDTLYNEEDYLQPDPMIDPAMAGMQAGYMQNDAVPADMRAGYMQNGAVPGGMQTGYMQNSVPVDPQRLVLHATTQYDANHQKVKVTEPHALGYGGEKPLIHGNSWVLGDAYCLDLDDPYCKANHPKLKKADPTNNMIISLVVAIIFFSVASANGIYEMLIWIFENMNMTDGAFNAIDNLIYYGQFFLPLIIIACALIRRKSVHKTNLMFCKQMLQHYAVEDEKLHFDRTHEFLDICPQCGAARLPDARECPYCGTSLLRMIEY